MSAFFFPPKSVLTPTLAAALLAVPAVEGCFAQPLKAPQKTPKASTNSHPPIPIRFHLDTAGLVTLVIEDAKGVRVRNLVSETPFPAGDNVAWWDGLDDLGRDTEAASHAIYHVSGQMVQPGTYRVRGLVHPPLGLSYQLTPYTNGTPPWQTKDKSSEWLANHTAPSAILFVPAGQAPQRANQPTSSGGQILVGSYISEGGSGLAWLDENGIKLYGQIWVGGIWTGVSHLARDKGPSPIPGIYAYSAAAWQKELRLTGLVTPDQNVARPRDKRLGEGGDRPILDQPFQLPYDAAISDGLHSEVGGLDVYNGLLAVSLPAQNRVLFVDVRNKKALGTATMEDPRGLAFDARGQLLVLSGDKLLRFSFEPGQNVPRLPAPRTLLDNLDDPCGITIAPDGQILISLLGRSNNVAVYSPQGKLLRSIGQRGVPTLGPYNPNQMHSPNGLSVDDKGRLWVAETDQAPKRISVWNIGTGALENAFYGPQQYGGGGWLDPQQRSRLFYSDEGGGQEIKLDWATGKSQPAAIYYRPDLDKLDLPSSDAQAPATPIVLNGKTYLTSSYNTSPTNGTPVASLYRLENGVAKIVAAVGQANDWRVINPAAQFSVRWSGQIQPPSSGVYTFSLTAGSGARLWVNGQKLFDQWKRKQTKDLSGTIALEAGKRYDIRIEWVHLPGDARARLSWSNSSQPNATIPTTALFPNQQSPAGGLTGEYFFDADLSQPMARRTDATVDFDFWRNPLPLSAPNPFQANAPAGVNWVRDKVLFVWSDRNDDNLPSPDEISMVRSDSISANFQNDLSCLTGSGLLLKPNGFSPAGAPLYDLTKAQTIVAGAQKPVSTGGGQGFVDSDGNFVFTNAPQPFSPYGIGGGRQGRATWTYPSMWPGLHASHIAPQPEFPGELIGTTRLLGTPIAPKGGESGEVWAINGNKGTVYLFTTDGLFISTLFKDARTASWGVPEATRGASMAQTSLGEESFWTSLTETADGAIYLSANGSILRLLGLEATKRLPTSEITLTAADIQQARSYFVNQEQTRQNTQPNADDDTLTVQISRTAPVLDGKLDDWTDAQWVTIDKRQYQVGNFNKRESRTQAALRVVGDRLYAAWKTDDAKLLNSSGDDLQTLFKFGGALDLMIGSNAGADPQRKQAVAGDERLLITQVNGQTVAALYRPVAPNPKPVTFTSPVRSITFDRVDDVSNQVSLAVGSQPNQTNTGNEGIYEVSVPLSLLGLRPQNGLSILGDVGVLRGNGVKTLQRVYWKNKASGLVSDVPSEAELTPQLWGSWNFQTTP